MPHSAKAARKALDYCMPLQRPEGGDYWETPLHAPNLLAAGHAAVAYYLGYELFGDDRYQEKAIYWIRSLLPFTHLWHPANLPMLYNTKPCLCSSDWYFANWVRDHVQWEVLAVFNDATAHGIQWHEVDPGDRLAAVSPGHHRGRHPLVERSPPRRLAPPQHSGHARTRTARVSSICVIPTPIIPPPATTAACSSCPIRLLRTFTACSIKASLRQLTERTVVLADIA